MKSTFCIVFRIKIVAFDSFLLKDKIILISYVPYVRLYSLYIEVVLNNPETSYLNLSNVSE